MSSSSSSVSSIFSGYDHSRDINTRTFKTDPLLELGTYATESENVLVQMSLQFPAKYYQARAKLLRSLLQDNVRRIYSTVWNALTEGQDAAGGPIIPLDGPLAQFRINNPHGGKFPNYRPRLPESEVNSIALSVTKAFKDVIEQQIVDRIMPKELYKAALERTAAKTASNLASGGESIGV
jgi:hypothetical protein